jgi:peptidoglycan/xylan/chitin deacetylase (PgdA/CDA1 family)
MAMRWLWVALLITAGAAFPSGYASAEDACPRAGTLGVSRTVEIDTTGGPGFGMEHYKAYDFLQPKEVVLTFDDGPQKYTTEAVLKALSDECVKATFFSVGKMALGYPEIIREVAKAGHTVGTHTWSHKAIGKLKTFDEGKDEIERGFSAVHRAVGGPIAPFFRFPTLVDTPDSLTYLAKRNIAKFSCDIDSVDYKPQTAEHLVTSLMAKLDKRGKGILLMHDIHKRTAQALPMLLAQLKAKGYKIVHMTAKAPVATLAEYDAAIEKDTKGLPQVGSERPMNSVVHTVGEASPAEAAPTATNPNSPAATTTAIAPAEPVAPAASTPPVAASSAKPTAEAAPANPAAVATPAPAAQSAPADVEPTGLPGAEEPDVVPAPANEHEHAAPATPATEATKPVTNSSASEVPATTSSVVRTVSGPPANGNSAANKPVAEGHADSEAAHQESKSITERAKETWKLWFGE